MEVECKHCGKAFEAKKNSRFCSLSCFAKVNNTGKNRWESKGLPKSRKCKTCGSEFPISRSNRQNTNCNLCIEKHKYNKVATLENAKTDSARKRNLIDECGHVCSVCKNTEWMGESIPIELDHIDGDSNNNERNNLRLICPNCHAQTKTYKGRNKGNGRAWRRERYLKILAFNG
jgi:hypothetical protein